MAVIRFGFGSAKRRERFLFTTSVAPVHYTTKQTKIGTIRCMASGGIVYVWLVCGYQAAVMQRKTKREAMRL